MSKLKVSEIFGPSGYWVYEFDESTKNTLHKFVERHGVTQGEGKYVGIKSTFVRMFGCNFTCPSFGLLHGEVTSEPDTIGKNVHLYKSISELPAAKYGCDSYYSWHSDFKHLSPFINVEEVASQILKASGGSFFTSEKNPVHLILTGGEPLLGWQRSYVELIHELQKQDSVWSNKPHLKLPVTFETNGTQELLIDKASGRTFASLLSDLCNITWSVSAKLTSSGHSNDEAIKPNVVKKYLEVSSDMYFKFVAHDEKDLDEIDHVLDLYKKEGVEVLVYVMPEGGVPEEYKKHATLDLVSKIVQRGYNITPRLHVMIGDNMMSW